MMTARDGDETGARRARVTLVSLGGTIASTPAAGIDGVLPQLGADDLLRTVSGALAGVEVDVVTARRIPSGDLTVVDVIALARDLRRYLYQGVDGVVVAQGTDTVEEVAFALDLLVDAEAPVVVTGAMRHPSEVGADGPANLLGAITLAASPSARNLGTVVVINDEVHAARFVRKMNTSNVAAFGSPTTGPIGRITEGHARLYLRPPRLDRVVDLDRIDGAPPVLLLACALGDDGRVLDHVSELGYAGVVIEAFGGGHVPATLVPALSNLAGRLPVVLASRTGGGDLLGSTYGYDGSERDLLGRGLIAAGFLDGRKARILLSLLLGAHADLEEVGDAFARLHRCATSPA